MHPALRIDNLSRLPGRYKCFRSRNSKLMATSAANGSLRDLTRLYSYLDTLGKANCQLLLPIFHRSLEPAGIPRATDLESSASSPDDCCARAAISLNCIAHCVIRTGMVFPPGLKEEFWPRIWAWIGFLHRYRDTVPAVLGADPLRTYNTYGSIIAHFALDIIDETPGLTVVIIATWKVLLGVDGSCQEGIYNLISQLINPVGMSENGMHLADLLEGAGGTVQDLAALLVLHIKCTVWTPQSSASPDTLNGMLFDGIRVVGGVCGTGGPVEYALLSCGVVKAILRALYSLQGSGLSWQFFDTSLCFVFHDLLYFLGIPPGYRTIRRALRAGLLKIVFDGAQQSETVSKWLTRLFKEILVPMTVYRSCLIELQKNFAKLAELEVEGMLEFQESRIFPEWSLFATLARARIRLMDEYTAGKHPSRKGCSNMDSFSDALLATKPIIAQLIVKPPTGAQVINSLATNYLWSAVHQRLIVERFGTRSRRDTAFLRTLVHSDYQRSRETVLVQHMFEGRAHPPSFSTVCIDYTGLPEYQLTAPQKQFPPPETAWERESKRRLNSGRMQLHYDTVAEGRAKARIVLPMHIYNTTVRSELRRIGSLIPEEEDADLASLSPELRDEINTLLALEVEEIH
ncbi:hypothetical protein DFH06DRAFT_1437488 [Mycena polygramma]|nr:hypothetical protein DFH06DRAFT_1437488 [Mycena polygramma]